MILFTRIIRIFYLVFFISGCSLAQNVSAVFIDSVKLSLNNEVIYESYKTYLKFLPNDKNDTLVLFDNKVYKLNLNFQSVKTNNNHLSLGQPELLINDTLANLITKRHYVGGPEWHCSGLCEESIKLTSAENDNFTRTIEILLKFRSFGFAPKNTLNYPYNYRQGEWIGYVPGTKMISVNYENDKLNGKAYVAYNNETIYSTNFINGIVDNYGYGTFENYKSSRYTIPNIISMSCEDNAFSFYLEKGIKQKEIVRSDNLSINFSKKGINNDSIEYNIQGDFVTVIKDTLVIKSKDLEVHDFYKKNTDSLHFYYKNIPSGFQKVPIKDITLIKKARSVLEGYVVSLTLFSLTSAFVVSPIISIQKHGFNTNRFLKVSGASLGVMAVSITVGVTLGSRKFLIKPTAKSKNAWKIVPENEYYK